MSNKRVIIKEVDKQGRMAIPERWREKHGVRSCRGLGEGYQCSPTGSRTSLGSSTGWRWLLSPASDLPGVGKPGLLK